MKTDSFTCCITSTLALITLHLKGDRWKKKLSPTTVFSPSLDSHGSLWRDHKEKSVCVYISAFPVCISPSHLPLESISSYAWDINTRAGFFLCICAVCNTMGICSMINVSKGYLSIISQDTTTYTKTCHNINSNWNVLQYWEEDF